MTISTNLILSLGMVGALSIVRFRTAVKDPLDIVFMFWSIAVGIANGAMQYDLAIVGSAFIAIILLILHYDKGMLDMIKKILGSFKIKSKSITNNNVELTLEVRVKKDRLQFLNELEIDEKIKDVVLISYDGEYVS
jgi:uncharacterized membrane protein YhiD involved in acid resistance